MNENVRSGCVQPTAPTRNCFILYSMAFLYPYGQYYNVCYQQGTLQQKEVNPVECVEI